MKKIIPIALSLIAIFYLIPLHSVNATVGGPTLVYDLKFDSQSGQVYFLEQNYSGKGCPPELKTISVETGKIQTVLSCNDENYFTSQNRDEKINSYTSNFDVLMPVNLRKNGITFSLETGNEEKLDDWLLSLDFTAHVFQNGSEKASISFTGCSVEQPVIIGGYRIPNSPDKVLLLISRKGNCFEGGYTSEFLQIVSGVSIADGPQIYSYKANEPLIPNEGNLVVYVESKTNEPIDDEKKDYPFTTLVLSAALALLIGIMIGRLSKRNGNITNISNPK